MNPNIETGTGNMTDFSKILIANRGEIAVRIIHTARNLGYRTVAVYSDADQDALHVQLADEAVHIGPAPVTESYLNIDRILAAARATDAQAIHPGYGFLSENPAFAAACTEQGICFIGPSASAIELMGCKRQSKLAVQQAAVPTVPGYNGNDQSPATLTREAQRIGTPLIIKAAAGGGGRGMRLVQDLATIATDLNSARSEAQNAFGSGELILEKAILNPRHIEIQIFADQHGNCVYLGERDCSVQRRHQKVIEEAPSPLLDPQLRHTMGQAAVTVARLCHYVGAGTVEFLVTPEGDFYFLEMNTRLQVEHPVTELITGQDLVEWQLRIAAGEPLPLQQDQIELQGHAIEVRLYAEDPYRNYLPQTGPVHLWQTPNTTGIRVDSGIQSGSQISPFYDPMLAKIIAYGPDRDTALRRLQRALDDTILLGTTSNRRFLRQLLEHEQFKSGNASTDFIQQHQDCWQSVTLAQQQTAAAMAAALLHQSRQPGPLQSSSRIQLATTTNENAFICTVTGTRRLTVNCNDLQLQLEISLQPPLARITEFSQHAPTIQRQLHYLISDDSLYLDNGDDAFHFADITHAPAVKTAQKGSGKIVSPMDGCLLAVRCKQGDQINSGDVVAVVEAMKMEHQIKAETDGIVQNIDVAPGQQLKARQQIMLIS